MKIIYLILSIFWIMLLVFFVKNLRAGRVTDPKELLNGQYYDYCDNYRYTFIQDDKELVLHDVHQLSYSEYHSFDDSPVYAVYLKWDEKNMYVNILQQEEEGSERYYMLVDPNYGILLIPPNIKEHFFQIARPLAFFLSYDEEAGTTGKREFHDSVKKYIV